MTIGEIPALGDSNPPHMAEAIGRAIMTAHTQTSAHYSRESDVNR